MKILYTLSNTMYVFIFYRTIVPRLVILLCLIIWLDLWNMIPQWIDDAEDYEENSFSTHISCNFKFE